VFVYGRKPKSASDTPSVSEQGPGAAELVEVAPEIAVKETPDNEVDEPQI